MQASNFLSPLSRKHYGPDVLADVPNAELSGEDIAIPPGDVIRLKRASTKWWNLPVGGKRQVGSKSHSVDSNRPRKRQRTQLPDQSEPVQIRYEEKFPEGGGHTFWAGPLKETTPGSSATNPNLYYYSDAVQGMVPIPEGYLPPVAAYTNPE